MKYLVHYSYYNINHIEYDYAWTDKEATIEDLQSLIESLKSRNIPETKFHGVYPLPDNQENILYSPDGTIKL